MNTEKPISEMTVEETIKHIKDSNITYCPTVNNDESLNDYADELFKPNNFGLKGSASLKIEKDFKALVDTINLSLKENDIDKDSADYINLKIDEFGDFLKDHLYYYEDKYGSNEDYLKQVIHIFNTRVGKHVKDFHIDSFKDKLFWGIRSDDEYNKCKHIFDVNFLERIKDSEMMFRYKNNLDEEWKKVEKLEDWKENQEDKEFKNKFGKYTGHLPVSDEDRKILELCLCSHFYTLSLSSKSTFKYKNDADCPDGNNEWKSITKPEDFLDFGKKEFKYE